MDLSALQTDLLSCLRAAVAAKTTRRIVYCSEWLGYLPFGLYHWVNAEGEDISLTFPWGWCRTDFEALEKAGLLAKIDAWENPSDEYETRITYEVTMAEQGAAADRPCE